VDNRQGINGDANAEMTTRRTVFFVSDQTGVTAETLGRSLLTQFESHEFDQVTVPFIDTVDKADAVVRRINATAAEQGTRPLVFSTLVQDELRERFITVSGLFLDFFEAFLSPLERELQTRSSHTTGRAHGMKDSGAYDRRIDATNFALRNDDGARTADYEAADVILVGVSRTGKTPTCLYLALAYGVFAANYPLSEDDLESGNLPRLLEPFRSKLYGLTISPDRLQQIRRERRSVGRYASAEQVRFELRGAEGLFRRFQIPFVDTTSFSIEEIASTILSGTGIERRSRP
jgi:[pyruvate, water dikinase]-phosphate phosphotransferase / [pyruvate, water dikinase] kinase